MTSRMVMSWTLSPQHSLQGGHCFQGLLVFPTVLNSALEPPSDIIFLIYECMILGIQNYRSLGI